MGLAAAGTASLQAAYAPDLGPLSSTKVWNISATLRGFYDDNYDTANDYYNPRGSYGIEVSPSSCWPCLCSRRSWGCATLTR